MRETCQSINILLTPVVPSWIGCGIRRRQRFETEDDIGRLFSDHDGWCIRVARRDEWHHRCVDDAQAFHAANLQIGRRDGILACAHRASSDRMMISFAGLVGILHQVFLTLDAVAGQPFGENEWSQRWPPEDVTGKL